MIVYKISYDFEHYLSFKINPLELLEKMPALRPKFLGESKKNIWVKPDADFYAGNNGLTHIDVTPDITTWSPGNLVLSPRAYEVLKDKLQISGEFLPVSVNGVEYMVFNTLKVINEDFVDHRNAVEDIELGMHFRTSNVAFSDEGIDGAIVFKSTIDKKVNSYCSQEFVDIVTANNLKGLLFEEMKVIK